MRYVCVVWQNSLRRISPSSSHHLVPFSTFQWVYICAYQCLTLESAVDGQTTNTSRLDICILKSQKNPKTFSTLTFHLKISTWQEHKNMHQQKSSKNKHLLEDPCQIFPNHLPMSHLNRWRSQCYWRRWRSAICSCELNMLISHQILWQGCRLCPFQAHPWSGLLCRWWIREKWRCARHVSSNWRIGTTLRHHWVREFLGPKVCQKSSWVRWQKCHHVDKWGCEGFVNMIHHFFQAWIGNGENHIPIIFLEFWTFWNFCFLLRILQLPENAYLPPENSINCSLELLEATYKVMMYFHLKTNMTGWKKPIFNYGNTSTHSWWMFQSC